MAKEFYQFDYDNYPKWTLFRLQSRLTPAENGCSEWQGATQKQGYGQICIKLKGKPAQTALCHRLLWELVNNVRLERHEYVLHDCDNPKCLNLDHLRVGTAKENSQDMVKRGRSTKGIKRPIDPEKPRKRPRPHTRHHTHDDDKIRAIRSAYGPARHIAEEFGVSIGYVSKIKSGKAKALVV